MGTNLKGKDTLQKGKRSSFTTLTAAEYRGTLTDTA